jgi:hypothetical protein
MTRAAAPKKVVAATLCCLAFAEWLLFELLRSPYRPPQDMLTFLGTEKYAVIALMFAIAIVGLLLLCHWAAHFLWSTKDVTGVAVLTALLIGAAIFVIFHPGRSVTPWHLLLK